LRRNCPLNTLLKERYKGQEEKEEDVSRYWMTLRKKKILELERGRTLIALCVELSVEGAMS
jgi:hypothetical protein